MAQGTGSAAPHDRLSGPLVLQCLLGYHLKDPARAPSDRAAQQRVQLPGQPLSKCSGSYTLTATLSRTLGAGSADQAAQQAITAFLTPGSMAVLAPRHAGHSGDAAIANLAAAIGQEPPPPSGTSPTVCDGSEVSSG